MADYSTTIEWQLPSTHLAATLQTSPTNISCNKAPNQLGGRQGRFGLYEDEAACPYSRPAEAHMRNLEGRL